eukprot:1480562-Pyramimonas_sp.AAC.1
MTQISPRKSGPTTPPTTSTPLRASPGHEATSRQAPGGARAITPVMPPTTGRDTNVHAGAQVAARRPRRAPRWCLRVEAQKLDL